MSQNEPLPNAADAPSQSEPVYLTILLKHHAGLDLDDVQSTLKKSDWWFSFPPDGVRIVSWTVAMGFAQICTLAVPPHLLAVVNVELERRAWKVFKTEVYPTYDFIPVRERIKARVLAGGQ